MPDVADGAPAPAESVSAPAPTPEAVATPNPVSTEREPTPPKEEAKPEQRSSREALQHAAKKVEAASKDDAKGDEPARTPNAVKTEGQQRGDDGKFASKDAPKPDAAKAEPVKAQEQAAKPVQTNTQTEQPAKAAETTETAHEAPKRFLPEAKTAWATTPEPVRKEVARLEQELSAGIEKYKSSHDEYEPIRKYADMAKANGRTLDQALEKYAHLDQLLAKSPINALEEICQHRGFTLRQVAEFVLKQDPDQQANQRDSEIISLKQELSAMKQQLGGVTGHIETQRHQAVLDRVNEFAQKAERFEELSPDINRLLETGMAENLEHAYEMAERLKPAPVSATAAPVVAVPKPAAAQTGKGEKSINGAPSAGSDPVTKRATPSTREALRSAFAKAG